MIYLLRLYLIDSEYSLVLAPEEDRGEISPIKGKGGDPGDVEISRILPDPLLIIPVENYEPEEFFFSRIADRIKSSIPETTIDEGRENRVELRLRWPKNSASRETVLKIVSRESSFERFGRTASKYTDLIFRTPLYRLNPDIWNLKAEVLVKMESMEPGSVKDRTVYGMLQSAILRGEIDENTEVIEASSGNVAYAMSAILPALLGRKPLIFISKMHGRTKAGLVRKSGCPIYLTPAGEGSSGAKIASIDYAQKTGAWQLNQHGNPDNPDIHRRTTGPEIYNQCFQLTGKPPAEFVTSLGSGGTAVGTAMYRDDIGAEFKVIGVEPSEASLLTGGSFHPHGFSGIAPGFITQIVARDRDRIDAIETVSREEGYAVCRKMLLAEGLLIGPSSGASIAAALRRAGLPENQGKVIITIAHDRGDRYLDIEDLFIPPESAFERDYYTDPRSSSDYN